MAASRGASNAPAEVKTCVPPWLKEKIVEDVVRRDVGGKCSVGEGGEGAE